MDLPEVAVNNTLDRSVFKESFIVLAIRIPKKRTGEFLKRFNRHLLNQPRQHNVHQDDQSNVILLSQSLGSDISKLPEPDKTWLEQQLGTDVHIIDFNVIHEYEYFTAEEILAKMLPEGVEIPRSYEQVGHVCHLNLRDCQLPYRFQIAQVILDKVKNLRTVVNKVGKIETEFRTFEMELLGGDPSTTVQLQEHECTFTFEFKDVYWNSRLQAEHGRLIKALFLEPVVPIMGGLKPMLADATCGVGPFSIPIVKHSTNIISHANDLNPQSIFWLHRNAEINNLRASELEEISPFQADFDSADDSSMLVIHRPGDARVFVQSLYEKRYPITHAIFNLPATGVELLDCYRGLDFNAVGLPRPLVCCYSFSDAPVDSGGSEGCVHDLLGRLSKSLGLSGSDCLYVAPSSTETQASLPLPSPKCAEMVKAAAFAEGVEVSVAIRFIRNVSTSRNMFCVCFRAPRVLKETVEHPEKRVRTE